MLRCIARTTVTSLTQGSGATYVRCGGSFSDLFTT